MTKINLEEDNRPYLFVKMRDIKSRGLLDSGAQSCVMIRLLFERLKKTGLKLFDCNVYITTADGTSHEALGYVKVRDGNFRGM